MQKQCTVDLWTAGYAGSRLTASARSPMDKPWTTLCVAHRLPTGRRLPTSSTVLKPIVIKSGKVKTKTPAPALAYSSPVAVQTTGTTALHGAMGRLGEAAGVESFEFKHMVVKPTLCTDHTELVVAFDGEVARMRAPIDIRVLEKPLYLLQSTAEGGTADAHKVTA